MGRHSTRLMKTALSAMHYTGADSMLSPFTRGAGVIFMLHHVRPVATPGFSPNRILEVTTDFLDAAIRHVVDRGFEVLSLDEAHFRMTEGELDRPFACFTFDDGYRDNKQYAYPIFKRHGLPFTIYVSTDFPEGSGDLWWLKLEKVIAVVETVEVKMQGAWQRFACRTELRKVAAFDAIYWWLRGLPEDEARAVVTELARLHAVDLASLCADLSMNWDEVRDLASDPLVTIGAHTRRHLALAKLPPAAARQEMAESVQRLEHELQRPIRHFSYPYGDSGSAGPREFAMAEELGFKTAVTTRKGLIHAEHAKTLTALPRLSLNGEFQDLRYLKVLLSGAPFALLGLKERMTGRPAEARASA